jgi:hypothetical protein
VRIRVVLRLVGVVMVTLLAAVGCSGDDSDDADDADDSTAPSTAVSETELRLELPDAFTPIVGSLVGEQTAPVRGTDGRWHVVYELWLTNAKQVPATIEAIEVLDFDDQSRVLETVAGEDLNATQLSVQPRELEPDAPTLAGDGPQLDPNESLLAFVELAFDREDDVPARIVHRLTGTGATNPGATEPAPIEYLFLPWDIAARTTPVIGRPLAGDGWVVINGCCGAGAHRSAVQTVNGTLVDAQRFAIDWMRIGENGMFFDGDPADVENWHNYDAPVLAVADGVVVEVLDGLEDQVPGTLPDPETITLETVDGNHVILDLGNGVYAFYAHLRNGSITVEEGETVEAGQELARLGNTGNTSGPHLHLHLMAGPSALAADGIPMSFESFELVGAIDPAQWAASTFAVDDVWNIVQTAPAGPRERELPLDLSVVAFPDRRR